MPVGILGSDVPLREEPAVTPLLAIMRVAVGLSPAGGSRGLDGVRGAAGTEVAVTRDVGDPAETLIQQEPTAQGAAFDELDPVTAAALVTSPVGGLDVVALRRLRRALRAEELGSGGGRTSDALLVEVLLDASGPRRCPRACAVAPWR
ncbi:hypothetical protein NKG05_03875 [Oerskovia sp. M15]